MKKRGFVLLVAILSLAMMACSFLQLLPKREASVTLVPTRTLKPTFTPTSTATLTPLPSATPTQTHTPTITPLPTNTPPPTDTPTVTPVPSDTPTPTATIPPTPRPTRRPTNTPVPKPTNTPVPPFTGVIERGFANCGYAGVEGVVKHANGQPYPDVAIGVWSDVWEGRVTLSEPSGKYSLSLVDVPVGKFYVAVVKLQTCRQRDGDWTAMYCQRLSNVIKDVTKTANCEGSGANQVTRIIFTGP